MNAITNWWFSQNGIGIVGVYPSSYGYAGGLVVVDFGNSYDTFGIMNLGNSTIALGTGVTDENGVTTTFYLNSHYGVSNDPQNNSGMMLWNAGDGPVSYASDSIGSEQTFRLVNLGGGNVALQATGGAFPGQYLAGMQGGWYPEQWELGSGSVCATASPTALQVHGPLLPILVITNSGYQLDLSQQNLAGLNLENADMRQCNLGQADLSGVTALHGANFTGANLQGANLSGQSMTGANWTGANFTGTSLVSTGTADKANFTNAILTQAVLTNVHLRGATLTGALLGGAVADGADLSGANMANVTATSASFKNAILQDAALSGATLTKASLAHADLTRADLSNANLSGADLTGADLTGANLTGANFTSCTVIGTRLGGNTITGTNFFGLDLTKADFTGALIQRTPATQPYSPMGRCLSLCSPGTGLALT
jgi:uncharacterized protein YjbI with pentapeptide repeats